MSEFNKRLTLMDSAQVFHWAETQNGFAALVNGRIMTDRDTDGFAARYFDKGRDYEALYAHLSAIPAVRKAAQACRGIRVLNQPPWEALVAFILSANNNVARIRNLVRAVCEVYGTTETFEGATLYGFPSPKALADADENELREKTKCGYRARYLIETAQRVEEGFPLNELRYMDAEDARKRLMTLPGVGGKVADCVLLFGCGHASAFPVDVWVERLMREWFCVEGSRERIRLAAREILGEQCGIIQQSLFHAARTGAIPLKKA